MYHCGDAIRPTDGLTSVLALADGRATTLKQRKAFMMPIRVNCHLKRGGVARSAAMSVMVRTTSEVARRRKIRGCGPCAKSSASKIRQLRFYVTSRPSHDRAKTLIAGFRRIYEKRSHYTYDPISQLDPDHLKVYFFPSTIAKCTPKRSRRTGTSPRGQSRSPVPQICSLHISRTRNRTHTCTLMRS